MTSNDSMTRAPKRKKSLIWRLVWLALLAVVCFYGYRWGPVLWDLYQKGVFKSPEKREYQGTNIANLQALRTALMLQHDSDGAFPDGDKWMDAITPRLKTYQYGESAMKKLIRPDLLPEKEGVYGYALNVTCSGKYKDDIKDPDDTPLVFVSKDTSKNAHGDPKKLLPDPPLPGGNVGISVSGKILKL